MTTPAHLTFGNLRTRVMNELRMPVSNTTEATKVDAVMNLVYRDICAKQDWWWLYKRTTINTTPKITDGTVSVTENDNDITFSTAPQQFSANVDVTRFALIITGQEDDPSAVYRIATHTAATVATLDAGYTGDTDTAAEFTLYQDQYELPSDMGKLLHVKRFGYPTPMKRIGLEELSALKQRDQSEGAPLAYTILDHSTTGDPQQERLLHVYPYPDRAYRMEVWYKQNLNTEMATGNEPFIPDDYRQVLVYGTLARAYPIFLNDTERGGFYQNLFNDLMALMAAQQREYAVDKAGVAPEMGMYRRQRRRMGAHMSLGSWFDRLPNEP